jgi:LysR family hydrogen peroxide-inducible transcriptional activator
MNLRDFTYLVALAENRSFKTAAKICNCTHPTLSMQIKKLEEYLQIQLFERNNKNVSLTPLGQEIYKIAKEIGKLEADIKAISKTSRNPFEGEIKIGAFPTLAPFYYPKIVPLLTKNFPDLKLFLIEDKSNNLIEMLENGEIDIAFLAMPVKNNNFIGYEVFEDEFFIAVPQKHSLAKLNKIKINDLKEEKLFLLNEGHCLRDQSLEFCKLAKINENQTFRGTSIETLRNMVLAGMGITIIPKVAATEVDGIKYLKIESKNATSRKIGIYWRKQSYRIGLYEKIAKSII